MLPTWERRSKLPDGRWNSREGEAKRGSHDDGGEDERHERPPSCRNCVFHGVCPSGQRISAHPGGEGRGHSAAIRDRPRTRYRTGGSEAPAGGLDRLKVERAGHAFAVLSDIIAEALTDRRSNILVPLDRARFERKVIPAGFLLDFAVALDRVERLDGSKMCHGEFLGSQSRNGRRR